LKHLLLQIRIEKSNIQISRVESIATDQSEIKQS